MAILGSTNVKSINTSVKPLRPSMSMEIVGTVPDRQMYNVTDKTYTPDYTLVPLVLFPRCGAVDASAIVASQLVNSQLTNMHWYEVINGIRKEITTGTDYSISTEGDTKGQLTVKKNSSMPNPTTLEFKAEYVKDGQTYVYRMTRVLIVSDSSNPTPVLMIDSAETVQWNPLRNDTVQKITAKVLVGTTDVTADDRCKIYFYRLLSTGALEAITDGNGDNDWEVDAVDEMSLTINRDYIGYEQTYVVKAVFRDKGELPAEPEEYDPVKSTRIVRYIPKMEITYSSTASGVPKDAKTMHVKAILTDALGLIPTEKINEYLTCIWFGKKASESTMKQVAVGIEKDLDISSGYQIQLAVSDKGPMALVVDDTDENAIYVDDDGNPVFIRADEQLSIQN